MTPALHAWATLWAGFDWSTASLLAAVVLLEGLRRVPPGAVVLRAGLTRQWEPVALEAGLRVVSWFAPISRTIILPVHLNAAPDAAEFSVRLRRIRPVTLLLSALGWLSLVSLLLGLPLAAAHFGGWGFLFAAAGLMLLAIMVTGCTIWGLSRTDMRFKAALRASLPLLSPFASGRAAEVLLEGATRGISSLRVARTLMPETDFVRWVRPRVFDAEWRKAEDPELRLVLSSAERVGFLNAIPAEELGGASFCPRCGHAYERESGSCPDCNVDLVRR